MTDDQTNSQQSEDSSENEESSALSIPQAEAIEEIIESMPTPEKRERARHIIEETFVGLIERSSPNQINPEVAKILADSADRDNDNKFKFLTQKQQDAADAKKRSDEFKITKNRDVFSLIKPVVFAVVFVLLIAMGVGVYLCLNGKETLGASLITGAVTSGLSFVAGLGTANILKDKEK